MKLYPKIREGDKIKCKNAVDLTKTRHALALEGIKTISLGKDYTLIVTEVREDGEK